MKRVLCIGDSLGLPRPQVPYEDTWISLLRQQRKDYEFIADFHRNATTNILSQWEYGEHLLFYEPEIIILQLGICDCAPRYLRTTSFLYRFLNHLPEKFSSGCWKVFKILKKRNINRTDVSLENFHLNVERYIQKCIHNNVQKIIIIKIATPGEVMVKSNPLIELSIRKYNQIYEEIAVKYPEIIVVVAPLHSGDNSCFVEDGYHPNGEGNKLVADALIKIL